MWLSVKYQPTSLFSLRDSQATLSGAKSHLFPSPYSVKMAILDIVLRYYGKSKGAEVFTWLKGIQLAFKGPRNLIVNNTFIKIAKVPKEPKNIIDPRGKLPFDRTVAFRQFVYHDGPVTISFDIESLTPEQIDLLKWALPRINYFGKRGSFFQFLGFLDNPTNDEIGTRPFDANTGEFPRNTCLQLMDDMGETLTFEKVDITDDSKITEKDREKRIYLFPYKLIKSSKGYSLYQNSTE